MVGGCGGVGRRGELGFVLASMCESYSGPAKSGPIKRLTRLNSGPIKRSRLYIYIYIYTLAPLLSGQCRTGGCPDNRIFTDIGGPDKGGARNSEINLNSSL